MNDNLLVLLLDMRDHDVALLTSERYDVRKCWQKVRINK